MIISTQFYTKYRPKYYKLTKLWFGKKSKTKCDYVWCGSKIKKNAQIDFLRGSTTFARGWKYTNKIGLIRSFPKLFLFSADSLQLSRFCYFYLVKWPLEQCSNRDHECNSWSTYVYVWVHSTPLWKAFTRILRSTQFGGAPEILVQRHGFRLAAGCTIHFWSQNAPHSDGLF